MERAAAAAAAGDSGALAHSAHGWTTALAGRTTVSKFQLSASVASASCVNCELGVKSVASTSSLRRARRAILRKARRCSMSDQRTAPPTPRPRSSCADVLVAARGCSKAQPPCPPRRRCSSRCCAPPDDPLSILHKSTQQPQRARGAQRAYSFCTAPRTARNKKEYARARPRAREPRHWRSPPRVALRRRRTLTRRSRRRERRPTRRSQVPRKARGLARGEARGVRKDAAVRAAAALAAPRGLQRVPVHAARPEVRRRGRQEGEGGRGYRARPPIARG